MELPKRKSTRLKEYDCSQNGAYFITICTQNKQNLFFEHIVRTETEYQQIWEYIDTNPLKWELDKYYVE